ncbi:Hypothetical protein, putative [Bodo saltans]|uniref:Uncharacterized protein n=1 Tax=Bodo saltans TaxID=75058 RepID=A0A0S4J0E9_BODSA|nr:Hypothetical protein, putative [Bodo saltans]|eukprot:CUG38282.1 Hypothetical protein, putative [Bodo saltans]
MASSAPLAGKVLQQLPFSLRYSFLEKGYAVVPHSLAFGISGPPASEVEESSSLVHSFRQSLLSAVRARKDQFLNLPSIESVVKGVVRVQDPLYEKLTRRQHEYVANRRKHAALKKRHLALKRQAKKKADGSDTSMSSDEIWRLTRAIYEELQSNRNAKLCRSTVDNDPQLLRAIQNHRVNTWMTERSLEDYIRGDTGKALGRIANEVGGISLPVLFADQPIARPAFGRPHYFHCAAPVIGVNNILDTPAATLLMLLQTPSEAAMPMYVVENSHVLVRNRLSQLQGTARRDLLESMSTRFLPMESHMRHVVEKIFPATAGGDQQGGTSVAKSVVLQGLNVGDVLIVDPCLLWGLGPNFTGEEALMWRGHVVGETSVASVEGPSWIRDWRSSSTRVDFRAAAVFPPLH